MTQMKMKQTPYIIGISLNLIFVLTELLFSQLAHSTALFADAFHNLSDVLALVIAWLAVVVFGLKATKKHTYGWHNLSILASLFNTFLLIGAVLIIFYEGISDLIDPPTVATNGKTVMIVAAIGIGINFFTAMLFKASGAPDEHGHHHEQDLNSKTAYIHLLADAGVSVGVIAGGLLIQLTKWPMIDAIISMIIGVIIIVTSWSVMASTFNLAINGVPDKVDADGILEYLNTNKNIVQLHDLHIWPLSTTEAALTVHLSVIEGVETQKILDDVSQVLRQNFNINHVTIQIETSISSQPCNLI
ncbi:cobalt transporter [Leuconostoc gasicomitatum]|uniref:Cobalt-zinc-cadmium resistance protein CzcD n=2 Tax=Leuconostoc TaxID=1243 RepID=A0AAN2UH01_9LACO|nr:MULTISPECIES: cation diffusion facilitator family transporter [Leuconostoc]MBZ5944275.1 cation transporter [Leuconostoc gasicomitatum]MBZ5945087.1 cation transporter [Leuconostoc gasicomitatum]MBZ5950517.1 cation transporter [Leuconostoc gasicomitatum]MBZ5950769.1 cation transporter [Leuconostoc gasicomitatum]MBZ5957326.1 cation transporter [Leuconostoc gasicomitatum]